MIRYILALLAVTLPASVIAASATAANDVSLSSEMLVERSIRTANGTTRIVLERPDSVPPGAKLFFTLTYSNRGRAPATNFVVTNPIPSGVAFESTSDAQAVVSVDGGKTWGALVALRVRAADGTWRAARPAEVTHIRWTLMAPIPVGGSGKFNFRGVVR